MRAEEHCGKQNKEGLDLASKNGKRTKELVLKLPQPLFCLFLADAGITPGRILFGDYDNTKQLVNNVSLYFKVSVALMLG